MYVIIAEMRYDQIRKLNDEYEVVRYAPSVFDLELCDKYHEIDKRSEFVKIEEMFELKDGCIYREQLPLFCVILHGGELVTCYEKSEIRYIDEDGKIWGDGNYVIRKV